MASNFARYLPVVLAIGVGSALATERYVPSQYPTIQAAINASVAGDTIWVAPGVYQGAANKNLDFHGRNLALQCQGAPGACVLDCEYSGRGFSFQYGGEGPSARIVGFAITHGDPHTTGGGVALSHSSPTFLNCIIQHNRGGGVIVYYASPTFISCLISDNWGVGLRAQSSGTCIIRNCTIVNNHYSSGVGGVALEYADAVVSNTIVWDNTGAYNGAQIGSYQGTVSVNYCDVEFGWTGPGEGNIDLPPRFVNPTHHNYHLAVGSPCIDAGDPNFVPPPGEVDLDGETRRLDGDGDGTARVDIGADEHNNDCNYNGIPDNEDITNGTSLDCNANGIPDECEIAGNPEPDCNHNGVFDICDIANGTSTDCNGDGVPDECQVTTTDCNGNGVWDVCDLENGSSFDFNENGIPDECEAVLQVPSAAYPTIQSALDAALPGATVLVAPGIYTGPGNRGLSFGWGPLSLVCDAGPGENCVLDCQHGARGAHIRGSDGYLVRLSGFTIVNGTASDADGGAGIFVEGVCAPTISNCVIRDCTASTNGGGMTIDSANPIITDCIVVNNSAGQQGGGIYSVGYGPRIRNCTVSGNSAASSGGGLALRQVDAIVSNTIVWGNSAPADPQIRFESGLLKVDHSDVQGGWEGAGNLDADPLFAAPGANDYHLLVNSPCIGAGNPAFVPALGERDTDGQPRIDAGRVDIGADEYHASDCNGNGVPDWQDIANGTSQDCSGNRIPDECEPDCNGNGVPDSCDIVSGTSSDRNANGLPDECEPHVFIYVDDDAPGDPAPGDPTISDPLEDGSLAHPFDAVQKAINAAGTGFEALVDVVIRDGTYTGLGNRDINFFGRCIVVRSEHGPQNCVIDCAANEQNPGRGFVFRSGEPPTAILQGLTIRGGWIHGWQTDVGGAGILCERSHPTIRDCIIVDNTLFEGGGVGICCSDGSVVTIQDCVIANNMLLSVPPYAWDGAGVLAIDSSAEVRNSVISGNSAAIYYSGGAGLSVVRGLLGVYDSVIAANRAYDRGAGLGEYDSFTRVVNCTFSGNVSSPGDGGGISNAGGWVAVASSVLWGDAASSGAEISYDYPRGTVRVACSDVQGGLPFGVFGGGQNIDLDPRFVAPEVGNYHLAPGSPCIDAGAPWYLPFPGEYDLDGQPRVLDGNGDGISRIDIGADEFFPVTPGDLNCDGAVTFDDIDLFVLALSDPASYAAQFPSCHVLNADCNRDGVVNFDDINPFVVLLNGGV
jgi:parallel beta-helix repeat protein